MNAPVIFSFGMAATFGAALTVVAYLNKPLHQLLIELCGTAERAAFWAAFSNVALVVTPLIFAATCTPSARQPAVFAIATQLKWSFVGLLLALVVIAWAMSRFIPRRRTAPTTADASSQSAPA